MKCDVIVLGAGVVGVATALNLQQRGRDVALVDLHEPGKGTSYGNAGVIQREGVIPYSFPQGLAAILSYALNNRNDVRYHLPQLVRIAPILFRYWRNGRPEAVLRTALANVPLFEHCLTEHQALAAAAGVAPMLRKDGWIKVFRTGKSRDQVHADLEVDRGFGFNAVALDRPALREKEPHLGDVALGGVHYETPYSVANPLALTQAYLALFKKRGGSVHAGDARTLERAPDGRWQVNTRDDVLVARDVVLSLGPWSDIVFRPLGYKIPFFVKRGYHLHYAPRQGSDLRRPVLDLDGGYVIAPMSQGIRVTSGIEIAHMDAPPTPVQLRRVEPLVRTLFPIDQQIEDAPWMGYRPCLPDMLPVIGKAHAHKGLYFAFGHGHHGLTLAGSTGRLIAEMVTGDEPFTDPAPYRIDRFGQFSAPDTIFYRPF